MRSTIRLFAPLLLLPTLAAPVCAATAAPVSPNCGGSTTAKIMSSGLPAQLSWPQFSRPDFYLLKQEQSVVVGERLEKTHNIMRDLLRVAGTPLQQLHPRALEDRAQPLKRRDTRHHRPSLKS